MPPTIIHDVSTNVLSRQAVVPAVFSATATSSALDMLTGDGRCWAEVQVGAFTATSITLQVSECDTSGGTYTDITGASIVTTAANNIARITFDRSKRYLKVTNTLVGTSAGYAVTVNEAYKTF